MSGNESSTELLRLKPPHFGKFKFRDLLRLISGGKMLTCDQYVKWQDLILYAVNSMRSDYERQDISQDVPERMYYSIYWEMLDKAETAEDTVRAINSLCGGIDWE